MADRLIVYQMAGERYRYRVCWEVDGDEGLCLGDACEDAGRDHRVASEAAAKMKPTGKDHLGFFWDEERDADAARKVANATYKNRSDVPWPEWAITAQAAGWKPPRGWKP